MKLRNDESSIDRLQKKLYSRGSPDILREKRSGFFGKNIDVKEDWEDASEVKNNKINPSDYFGKQKKKISFFKVLFFISILFFIGASAFAGYKFFVGGNTVSADNVEIIVTGPVSVSGGEVVSFDVDVLNKNSIGLKVVELIVEFPSGTANADDTSEELRRYSYILGDIASGELARHKVNAVFFGEEGSKREIKFMVEYRIPGSNAIPRKQKNYEFFINRSPISLAITGDKEVVSGQNVNIKARITSNSEDVIKGVVLVAQYPFGYQHVSSEPNNSFGNNVWYIGDLPPKSARNITIKGKMTGEDDDQRVFRFSVGKKDLKDDTSISIPFLASNYELVVQKPFMSADLDLNGDSTSRDLVIDYNSLVKARLRIRNNLDVNLNDVEVKATISGNAISHDGILAGGGIYRTSDKTITWNKFTSPELSLIEPGETENIEFNLEPIQYGIGSDSSIRNPQIKIDVSLSSKRASERDVPETLNSFTSRLIKIEPRVSITAQTLRDAGPIDNSGPIPPEVEKTTTYSVMWTFTNTSSNIANAKMEAYLPPYVEWKDVSRPSSEDIEYSPENRKITWKIGRANSYTGISSSKRQVYFQLAVTPLLSQVGSSPEIISQVVFTGSDEHTGSVIDASHPSVSIRYQSDSTFKDSDGIVIR